MLNTKIGDNYLFSGSTYDTAPVDITDVAYTPTAAPGTPDTDYYQGNGVIDSVRASSSLQVDYGVTADNPAFEMALRALAIFIADPTTPATITSAYALNKQAIGASANITGTLIAKSGIIQRQLDLHGATTEYLTAVISTVREVDLAAATVRASQIETQLQASFGTLSKLLTLRLTDFLR